MLKGSRELFIESWLCESPQDLGTINFGNLALQVLKDRLEHGGTVINLDHLKLGLRKIDGNQVVLYWLEEGGEPLIVVELNKKPQCLEINATSKIGNKGKPPFASEIYRSILKDQPLSLLMSDVTMSVSGLKVWVRLLNDGYKVSVYDSQNPGTSFTQIHTEEELKSFMGDKQYRQYRYVLSESNEYGELREYFNLRRLRELSGTL